MNAGELILPLLSFSGAVLLGHFIQLILIWHIFIKKGKEQEA